MTKEVKTTENIAYRILVEPWITEAATMAAQMNKYIFKVAKVASKSEVKRSIEELYKVTVLSVRTVTLPAKKRIRGRVIGRKPGFKKAIVTVKEGESIDVFGGK
ncbi:MAG: 50S ribosomal protein L23 [Candidatus Pacebacteria bacterium]|nr:50S ribosomal protein L23 [Candidatus Paceibacterota bacterium]MDR3583602.1 50S ribosomal protein L23 [Candidatus Paceibacterota bacterium]